MSKLAKIIVGVGATILVVLIAGIIFLHHLVTKSYPVTSGAIVIEGLQSLVEIYRDDYGVPHISASNEHDLMFAVGYVHAQDRLWQMDLGRRIGQGRLSELMDTATVKFDKLFRTLGFVSLADSLEKYLHPTSRRLLEDYSSGVNEFIVTHKGKLPIEFDMLNYEPEIWTVQHSLLLARLLAWELNFAWWVDLTYAEIAALVPQNKFQELFLSNPEIRLSGSSQPKAAIDFNDVHEYLSTVRSYRDFFNKGPLSAGSNAWAINSAKSLSGKPILANDPHLIVTLPAKWYELHLSAPGWNVSGFSVPGIPLIVIGHNDSLAWGFTNAMLDDADFYIEQEDSININRYKFKNSFLPMHTREEIIHIGSQDSIVINVRSTLHGPIINDVHPISEHAHAKTMHNHPPISMRWTGFEMSDEILGFYRIDRATNKIEFEEGLKQLTVPAQCPVYADIHGNIGWWVTGRVPVRSEHDGVLPLIGWTGEDEWKSFVSFEKLPKILNPPEGIIVSANQKFIDRSYPYYLSTLWEPSSRYDRIREMLSLEKMSTHDFQQFQQDVVSYYSRDLTIQILGVFTQDSIIETSVNEALVYLKNWNYRCTQTDIASTIVNTFFVKLIHNIYEDELGSEVFNDFIYPLSIPYQVTRQLMLQNSSLWFDDIRTDTIETKAIIIRKSFIQVVAELKATLGSEMKNWQWGKIHQVVFEHLLGRRKPLDKVFNVGPFPAAGGEQTVSKGAFKLTDPFRLFAAPSMRQIVDLADPTAAYTIITLGQSGQPISKHYNDQVSLWLNGGYKRETIDWNEIKNQNWDRLTLKPK